ncbi:MAG: hypothetical protein GWO20_13915, partial [Candidatus Korarchaeota archaeon]|nr:hypothetical protein [Candidatus Korarchaeota archaeon]NIU84513.1 hypothetical protein [Candidatus Thorarchaeota archaeon]NIW14580.1 hypothetical protein [Candidatus Thorarchaeota archaeon]NIW52652.1 hypothetical protein [Candidatus Korarchaeota archaeon]
RLGDKRTFLLFFGFSLISIGLLIYGISFSVDLVTLLQYETTLPLETFAPYWKFASFLIIVGYVLLSLSYSIQSFKRTLASTPVLLSMFSTTTIESIGSLLTLYLLFLVSYSTKKVESRKVSLTITAYGILFVSQLLITGGLFTESYPFFLWGLALRGMGFLPLLLVALGSGGE